MKKKWEFFSDQKEKGQVLLIMVLVMVISLTIGLSVVSKSITSLKTSTDEVNSQKALSAAEAGIEQSVKNNISIANGSFFSDSNYSTTLTSVRGPDFLLNGGNPILQDEGLDLWLSNYSADPASIYTSPWSGSLTIYWGDSSIGCNNAALEVALISGSKAFPSLTRLALDPCLERSSSNHLEFAPLSSSTIPSFPSKNFYYKKTITVSSGLIARIIPIYLNTHVAVSADVPLPRQGSSISSIGKSGGAQRKVNVFQGYPAIPSEYFPYVLFSP